ncbi:hypothetical protein [Streptomyces sp. H27-C3]|uniref:hypothetical protein n=1 Tax=Streptomyces sp. H27-C3 TaxID=3046305 RepID=UPI0024B904D6|nr:hypothetical protein [Streptomyces sp. H27-C3]MDJ0462152.1 hypothetical protein [Streptomyces sp. H27-C3]
METVLSYLVVLAIFVLLTFPPFVGHARDRRIDRQLRRAEGPTRDRAPTALRTVPGSASRSPADWELAGGSAARDAE